MTNSNTSVNEPQETALTGNSKRIDWIDIAKGLAILCVFFGHTITTPDLIGDFIYFFHMPAFFFLSGYCFSNRRKIKDFIITKLRTIILPIFTLGFGGSLIVAILLTVVKHETFDWKAVFLYPIIQYGNKDLLWYLPTLFVALIVFYCLTKICRNKHILLICLSFVIAAASYCFIRFVGATIPWHIDTALIALPFLACGYILKEIKHAHMLKSIWVSLISLAICLAAGFINAKFFNRVEMHVNSYGNIVLFYISALAGSIMVISVSMLIKQSPTLEYLGKNTIILYAFEPIQYFANFLLKSITASIAFTTKPIGIALTTMLAVLFIAVCYSILALIINRYLPWCIGKKRQLRHE